MATGRTTATTTSGGERPSADAFRLAAQLINESLYWAYQPCDDFYKFVCSRFEGGISTLSKIEQYTRRSIQEMLLNTTGIRATGQSAADKAAAMFQACVRLGSSPTNSEIGINADDEKWMENSYMQLGGDLNTARSYSIRVNIYDPNIQNVSAFAARIVRIEHVVVPGQALSSARQVLLNVRSSLLRKLRTTDWIRAPLKNITIEKAENYGIVVGYPDAISSEAAVEALYADFPDVGAAFFDAYLQSLRVITDRNVRGVGLSNFSSDAANAQYEAHRHTITVFAGLLLPPVYIHNGPPSFNYAGFGQVRFESAFVIPDNRMTRRN
ncbi:hypothetical protein V5799_011947 [Amblyomma americanum]|uniref:Peptidase M13 N-terminal domain-containing protein n=1 Tax=Amblyomma americanum TaxID=6943 RepID=A0AAQ4EFX1_AMBAM